MKEVIDSLLAFLGCTILLGIVVLIAEVAA